MKKSTLTDQLASCRNGTTLRSQEFGPPTKSGASKVVNETLTFDARLVRPSSDCIPVD